VEYKAAKRLDPNNEVVVAHIGHPYFVRRDFDNALKHYQESLTWRPQQETAHYFIGRVYREQGKFLESIDEFESGHLFEARTDADKRQVKADHDGLRAAFKQGGPEGYWKKRLDLEKGSPHPNSYTIATIYANLKDKPNAYRWLNKACEEQAFRQGLWFDLCWDHNDPEFQAIAKRIGLVP
jgi:tetratricopeptide (TPR) repeat protein